jgi:hypothetical protein
MQKMVGWVRWIGLPDLGTSRNTSRYVKESNPAIQEPLPYPGRMPSHILFTTPRWDCAISLGPGPSIQTIHYSTPRSLKPLLMFVLSVDCEVLGGHIVNADFDIHT